MNTAIDQKSLISWRRWFHLHPETTGQEKDTAAFLAQELAALGLAVRENVFGYGLVAELKGKRAGKCLALRADMDALPVKEETGLDFQSRFPGVMHACGHDAHMAILLGTAAQLAADPPPEQVKFILQPSEEKPPGGAKFMIEAGVLQNPDVNAVLGLHVSPFYPVGTIAIKEGVLMAIADNFELVIKGKSGHGAAPHLTADPITISAQVIQGLQHVISRRVDPAELSLISFGTIHGGSTQNIIPERVVLTGTVRSTNRQVQERIIDLMHQTIKGITDAWGAAYELHYLYGYPPVINPPEITRLIMDVAKELPELTLKVMEKPVLIGEDFAYYGQSVPAGFFFLGCGSQEKTASLHNSCFDIDEACLPLGVKIMTRAVRRFLQD
ncbi:M20 metallopeptidase family protein [Dehalobacterium formicoaceticum]|uniref:Amidohydrolase n=1 Tax=Dehalobacterium formicoaceticum TaxID=51515 RepID=A0ABT1Y0W1_9FIRM|nr:amidohydrolase [Dehalobacterium formicoaceticum]MCR6544470.1 amidohydrolase [Dehalobacterium formicoaceticum]